MNIFKKIKELTRELNECITLIKRLTRKLDDIELRVRSLENPPKYEIGQDLKFYTPNHCGEFKKEIVSIKIVDRYYSIFNGWNYSVFDGQKILNAYEDSLCVI